MFSRRGFGPHAPRPDRLRPPKPPEPSPLDAATEFVHAAAMRRLREDEVCSRAAGSNWSPSRPKRRGPVDEPVLDRIFEGLGGKLATLGLRTIADAVSPGSGMWVVAAAKLSTAFYKLAELRDANALEVKVPFAVTPGGEFSLDLKARFGGPDPADSTSLSVEPGVDPAGHSTVGLPEVSADRIADHTRVSPNSAARDEVLAALGEPDPHPGRARRTHVALLTRPPASEPDGPEPRREEVGEARRRQTVAGTLGGNSVRLTCRHLTGATGAVGGLVVIGPLRRFADLTGSPVVDAPTLLTFARDWAAAVGTTRRQLRCVVFIDPDAGTGLWVDRHTDGLARVYLIELRATPDGVEFGLWESARADSGR